MSGVDALDDVFAAERARLVGLAYRITGSRTEAEDVVQDAWLRWQTADRAAVVRPAAWLTTVTSRIALDHLKSAHRSREAYVGPWLPEPVDVGPGPDDRVELAESLTLGFLAVLERLEPTERVVFILADVFRVPYDEIAEVVGRSSAACRQVASRARRRVTEERPLFAPTDDEAWRVTSAFIDALAGGDIDAVTALLAPDVVHISDGGAHHRAARRPVLGAERVARLMTNLAVRLVRPGVEIEPRLVNGQPGLVVRDDGAAVLALACSVVDGRIDRVFAVVNPEKLAALGGPPVA